MDSMLQRFLDADMLDIDNNDTQYLYLSETAQELAEFLTNDLRDVIPFTLVALDPSCAPSDPVFERIEETLKARWKLLRKRFADRPRQIYRAIAFEALSVAGTKHDSVFPLVWLTGSSYLPYARLNGEIEICREFFRELAHLFETRSHAVVSPTTLPKLQIRQASSTQDLEEQWAASISPHPYKGVNLQTSGRNPNSQGTSPTYFPQQPWIAEFAPRAAELLVNFYNDQTERFHQDIEKFVSTLVQSIQGVRDFKSDILWWRQTLYSASQHQSYREIEADLAAIIMAVDLHQQTPPVYPISVDHMLHEAVIEVLSRHNRPATYAMTLENYLELIDKEDHREVLQPLLEPEKTNYGRNSLLALTQAHLHGKPVKIENACQRLGVSSEDEIPLWHLAVWLFRDLQAQKIIEVEEYGK
ncbi:MAG TPA: GTPase-associated system all-helical protein GASH [Ktedonobacteraceae bacterium]|nr:GTPase-associated system all-helical protein GASH [Ktedonobacteraceae bacterium]